MPAIRTWRDQLEALHKKSGFYWPTTDHPYTNLLTFLVGFQCGYGVASEGLGFSPDQLVPLDFSGFVAERFRCADPDLSDGWRVLIREHTSSEQEAFEMFFQLRDEYERHKSIG